MGIKVRYAKPDDSSEILRLIVELAKFEKLSPPNEQAKKRLIRDAFSDNPPFSIIVAEANSELVGYAFYFFTYSTFNARKSLYLEDIFVTEKLRSSGVGKKFFQKLFSVAKQNKCKRMEWCVLNWNKRAIKFYNKLGAKPLDEWTYYRKEIKF